MESPGSGLVSIPSAPSCRALRRASRYRLAPFDHSIPEGRRQVPMRKVLLLLSIAAVAVSALVATASARTETSFSVVEIQKSSHRAGHNTFITRGQLVQPTDQDEAVGHDVVKGKVVGHRRFRIRAIAYF